MVLVAEETLQLLCISLWCLALKGVVSPLPLISYHLALKCQTLYLLDPLNKYCKINEAQTCNVFKKISHWKINIPYYCHFSPRPLSPHWFVTAQFLCKKIARSFFSSPLQSSVNMPSICLELGGSQLLKLESIPSSNSFCASCFRGLILVNTPHSVRVYHDPSHCPVPSRLKVTALHDPVEELNSLVAKVWAKFKVLSI